MAGIGIPSPLRTFGLPSMRCGAARRTGLSLQLQYLQEVDSHNADMDETALAVLARVFGVSHRSKRGDFVN